MLKVKSIDVYYGESQALWNISFNVKEGELVAIVGPNGAGKTTIMRTLTGLLHPKKGSIFYKDKRLDHFPPHRIAGEGIALVPEGRQLFPKLTVFENLLMGGYNRRARDYRQDSLEYVFSLFPVLRERRSQTAETLSGGESQMLAIGRALMAKPKMLLLDEPSLGLAPNLVVSLFHTIKSLHDEGLTILIVEQHVPQVLQIADRAYVLENGSLVLEGAAEEVFNNERIKTAYLGL